jgi:predicted dinucleotide-binding enzyme
MRIGIIGAGHIGRALASLARGSGHEAMLSNSRGPDTLRDLAATLGCAVGTPQEAAQFGPIVMVAIPFGQRDALATLPLASRILVDANNYYPQRDGRIEALDAHTTTTSLMLAQRLPSATVVKAFNAILARDLMTDGRPKGSQPRRALPMAGDDAAAKRMVARLIDDFGFDPIDAGTLADSWRFERAKSAYCIPFDAVGLRDALAAAERDVELPDGSWRTAR